MKKVFAIVLCLVLALTLVACSSNETEKTDDTADTTVDGTTDTNDTDDTTIANPFTEYATLEEAAAQAGDIFEVPETVAESAGCIYRVSTDGLFEVVYTDATDAEVARVRRAVGTEDISGDYNEYAHTEEITVGNLTVTVKGADEGNATLATWVNGIYTYSMSVATGMACADLAAYAKIVE